MLREEEEEEKERRRLLLLDWVVKCAATPRLDCTLTKPRQKLLHVDNTTSDDTSMINIYFSEWRCLRCDANQSNGGKKTCIRPADDVGWLKCVFRVELLRSDESDLVCVTLPSLMLQYCISVQCMHHDALESCLCGVQILSVWCKFTLTSDIIRWKYISIVLPYLLACGGLRRPPVASCLFFLLVPVPPRVCRTSVFMTLWHTLTSIHDITTKYPKPAELTIWLVIQKV
jgi:hypothetical protein